VKEAGHDGTELQNFVAALVGLERVAYEAAMRAIRRYVNGLHRIGDDLALGYALLVASVESLAQGFDDFRPSWGDYDQAKREAIDAGLLWVAVSDARPVGFAHAKLLEAGRAHLDELDVHPDHGRRGVGRRLVGAVCDWAAASSLDAVTLSTFRAPPWNAPFYASMGFRVLADHELTPALRRVVAQETRRGLDPTQRVVMYRGTRMSQR